MRVVRLLAAAGIALVAFAFACVIGLQCLRLVDRNLALAHELGAVRSEVADLRRKQTQQQRTIRRLHDPAGAIPEIHDRLRLVAPNEALIFVRGAPTPEPPELR